jgi:Uma2 family endonuclease
LLFETFQPATVPLDQVFSAIDMNLYYDEDHPLWQKRPDWFGVLGAPRLYKGHDSRLSYVVWDEGVAPLIIVELLSPKTAQEDLGQTAREPGQPPVKWEVYQEILRVPYYVIFSREAAEIRLFRHDGRQYEEVLGHEGRYWLPEAGIGLGLWPGSYQGIERLWLRWYDAEGNWIATREEMVEQERARAEQQQRRAEQQQRRAEQERKRAEQERKRAEQEQKRAEQERKRAERLAELLRQLGQDPDRI